LRWRVWTPVLQVLRGGWWWITTGQSDGRCETSGPGPQGGGAGRGGCFASGIGALRPGTELPG